MDFIRYNIFSKGREVGYHYTIILPIGLVYSIVNPTSHHYYYSVIIIQRLEKFFTVKP